MAAEIGTTTRDRSNHATVDAAWKALYRTGGAAALMIVVMTVVQVIVFVAWPPPGFRPTSSNVVGWFTLFQHSRLLALRGSPQLFSTVEP